MVRSCNCVQRSYALHVRPETLIRSIDHVPALAGVDDCCGE